MANESLDKKKSQIIKAERLQDLLLDDFTKLAESGGLSATDRATLVRFLSDNGWDLDPARIPQSLKDKLTKSVRPDEDLEAETGERRLKVV